MSFTSSPSRDVVELFRRRNLTNIPGDQRKLLEDFDSWAVDLRDQPHGLAHVPGHVLKTVKEAYVARKIGPEKHTPKTRKRSGTPAASSTSKRMRNGTRNGMTSTPRTDGNTQASSPGSVISWPQSDHEGTQKSRSSIRVATPHTAVQSSIVHETPKPEPVAPRRRLSVHAASPASDESEDVLETDVPQGLPHAAVSVNRAASRLDPIVPSPEARTMATPPCAQPSNPTQPVIPSTVVANREATRERTTPGKQRTRRPFKRIDVDDTEKKAQPNPNRLPATRTYATVESSIPTSSDSIIPATYKAPATQDSVVPSIEENEPVYNTQEAIQPDNAQSPLTHQSQRDEDSIMQSIESCEAAENTDTIEKPVTTKQTNTPKQAEKPHSVLGSSGAKPTKSIAQPLRIEPSGNKEPYEVFIHHYPSYAEDDWGRKEAGTRESFVNACVYLNYLRRRNLLRDCLYDDFIRAFTEDYREYVQNARPCKKTMVAISWFNKLCGKPVYGEYVVNRGNLSLILKSYPEEVANANKIIMQDDDISIYTSSESESELDDDDDAVSSPKLDRACQHKHGKSVESNRHAPLDVSEVIEVDGPATPPVSKPASSQQPSSKLSEKTSGFQASENPNPGATTVFFTPSRDSDSGSAATFTSNPKNVHGTTIHNRNASHEESGASDVPVL
ncbi:hypothetical protein FALBO_10943 [Fusarium albosuccineum]|uniref:Uncharacterized protein n=1 Tax=Fusarium albosuccineum TaxID=1237068 RepID=A0A8H4L3H4_9HYPO|nr:hypothetical protein FALBO_10943 [Fusarium albosuccineum]